MAYTTTGNLGHFLPPYWDAVLGENLYPNLYFYQFGTKRSVPRNFGTTIKIPRIKKQNLVATVPTEGTPIVPCGLSNNYISGTMAQYAGAYKHSDLIIMTAFSDVINLSLIEISRDIARRMDRSIRNALSGTGTYLSNKSSPMYATDIIQAVVTLDAQDNPRPPDNHYPTIIHPITVYDIQASLSGGNWLDVNKANTGENAEKIFKGEIGRLYGARFVTSSIIKRVALSSGTTLCGTRGYMFAPDAYYVTEISDMTAKTYVKQLGSAGAADPVNQFATVGAKVYFGVVPATWSTGGVAEHRMLRLMFNDTLAGGDTVS